MSQATQPCRHPTGDHSQHGSARHATEHGCERFRNVSELRSWHALPTWPPLPVSWQGPGKSQTQLTARDRRKAEPRTRGAWLRESGRTGPGQGHGSTGAGYRGWPSPLSNHGEQGWTQDPAWMGHSEAPCTLPPFQLAPPPPQPGGCQGVEAPRKDRLQPEGDPTSPKALRSG